MTTIKCGDTKVNGGFFVMSGRQSLPYSWAENTADLDVQFRGTYRDSGTPIKDDLLRIIRNAKHRVFIASFMLGDDDLVAEMLAAAERLKGSVYLITALDDNSMKRGLEEYDEDDRQPPEQRKKNFERLTSAGVYVRGHGSCHAKFAVVDNEIGFLGSANFESRAFTFTGEANFLIYNQHDVSQLSKLFTLLWFEGCKFEVPPGKVYKVADRHSKQSPAKPFDADFDAGRTGVVWTNEKQQSLLHAIQAVIDSAERELLLASYSFTGMFRKSELLVEPIKRAIRRGVNCRLFIRQKNAFPNQLKELRMFSDLGVKVYGDLRNHAKAVIADDKAGVLFSANFDANHGLDSGVEIGMRTGDSPALASLKRYFEHVISNADAKFVIDPTQNVLGGNLVGRWCTKWPFAESLNIEADSSINSEVINTMRTSPVIFEASPESGNCKLIADSLTLDAKVVDSRLKIKEIRKTGVSISDQLDETLKFKKSTSKKLQGFCTANLHFPVA